MTNSNNNNKENDHREGDNSNGDEYVMVPPSNTNNTMSNSSNILPSHHQDYIFAIAMDVYGRKMATCAGDRMVRIYELMTSTSSGSNNSNNWELTCSYQAHKSTVTDVTWAHAEFGQLLATASTDHDVKIWEFTNNVSLSSQNPNPNNIATATNKQQRGSGGIGAGGGGNINNTASMNANSNNNNSVICKATLSEGRRAMNKVEFAPRHYGLKLATASSDGNIRIYEAVDLMNLTQWPLSSTLTPSSSSSSSSSGGGATSANMSSSGGSGGSASGGSDATTSSCRAISWCTGRFDPPTLVVGTSKQLVIYRYSETARAWQNIWQRSIGCLSVAWAPSVGRRFHRIAVATDNNKTLQIYKFVWNKQQQQQSTSSNSKDTATTNTNTNTGSATAAATATTTLTMEHVQEISDVRSVWQVQWNVTGTVVASTGEGGMVHMYRANNNAHQQEDNFVQVANVQGNLSHMTVQQPEVSAANAAANSQSMMVE